MASYHSRVVDSDSLMKEVDEYMNAHDEEAAAVSYFFIHFRNCLI